MPTVVLVPSGRPAPKIRLVATFTGVGAYTAPAAVLGSDVAAVACGQHLFTELTLPAAASRAVDVLTAKDPGHTDAWYRQRIVHSAGLGGTLATVPD